MNQRTKYIYIVIFLYLLLIPIISILLNFLPLINNLHWKIYDRLTVIGTRLNRAPLAAKDILLVVLDNKTLTQLPDRWPYPRAYFARVIENLNKAGVKLIGFDFIFIGKSSSEDDNSFKESLQEKKNIVFASTINEKGEIDLFSSNTLLC